MILHTHLVVYNRDCLEAMREMEDNAHDLALIDPPYGIGASSMRMGLGTGKACSKAKNRKWKPKKWDDIAPDEEFFEQLFRVSKNQVIWGGNYFPLPPCNNFVIWDKQIPAGLSFSDCEFAWTSFSGANKIFRHSVYLEPDDKFHPTQKPVALYDWLIHNYAKGCKSILDTHVGSGSSRIAAYKAKIPFTGFELDADYHKAAEQRFLNHASQLTMF